MSYRPEKSNRVAGFVSLVGAAVLGCGAAFPWVTISGALISFKSMFDFKPNLEIVAGGLTQGGMQVLAAAGAAALLALIVIATTRTSNIMCRLGLVVIGGISAYSGGYLIYLARTLIDSTVPDASNPLLHFAHNSAAGIMRIAVTVQPGKGAYAMAAGGALVALGGLIPSSVVRPIFFPTASMPSALGRTDWPEAGEKPALEDHVDRGKQPHARRAGVVIVLALVAMVALGVALLARHSTTTSTVQIGGASATAPAVSAAELQCVKSVTSRESSLTDSTFSAGGRKDTEAFFRQVASMDDSACPAAFISAHQQWVQAWQEYAALLTEAEKFHAPWNKEWSTENISEKKAALIGGIQRANDAVEAAAREAGVDVAHQTWSVSG